MIVIFNPTAGNRRVHRLWQVLDILTASGIRVQLLETEYAGHATFLARAAAASGARKVVAAGGDGTIAEVAAGLAGSQTALGIIPLGTANVLALELNLPFTPRAIAASLAFGRTRLLWPGFASFQGGERLFVQMVGVGLDAQVVHHMPRGLKRLLGRGAYVALTLCEIARYPYKPLQILADGAIHHAQSVVISKGSLYAGHYLLAPDAKPSEPGFQVALFGAQGPAGALMYGAALTLNLLPQAPGMRLIQASTVDVLSETQAPAQADGDPAGLAPLHVTNAASPLHIITA